MVLISLVDRLMKKNDLFTIRRVSTLTDLPPCTLRFWEKKFSEFLTPMRTKGGQRRYRGDNISLIKTIKNLRKEGVSLGEIRNILNGQLQCSTESPSIDLLATRLAEVVKIEVYDFFRKEIPPFIMSS